MSHCLGQKDMLVLHLQGPSSVGHMDESRRANMWEQEALMQKKRVHQHMLIHICTSTCLQLAQDFVQTSAP